ncbi:amidase [Corynebacterium pacaense]|uniref:amidase n=1 Tax=Corynebacterium pacaense TaxID=1816684 RepID=UPI0009B9F66C|nr:amidase [Corynebacterium pacaense]
MSLSLSEYSTLDATALAALIRSGEVDPDEVQAIARTAIESLNSSLNALAFPLADAVPSFNTNGPFGGVPFLAKDEGPHVGGFPWSGGSRYFDGQVAASDTEQISRARSAGLAILGSTATPEFSMSFATESRRRGITRNPWDLSRTPGGSSGGAAALVAAGGVPIAHATDGLGSIRIPASFCGLVGLKPTRGRTPQDVDGFSGAGYDFVLTRTLRDCALALDTLAGPGRDAKYRIPAPMNSYLNALHEVKGSLRVGVATQTWNGVAVDPAATEAALSVARELESAGHIVDEVTLPIRPDAIRSAFTAVCGLSYLSMFIDAPVPPDRDSVEAVTLAGWREARSMPSTELAAGLLEFDQIVRDLAAFFEQIDVLVTPTSTVPAFAHGTLNYDDPTQTLPSWLDTMFSVGAFTAPFNIGGQPAISLPVGSGPGGLPIGVQLVAASGREDLLFSLSAVIEQSFPWDGVRPPLTAGSKTPPPN